MLLATRGMVAAPHALASEAGVEVLRAGGSAVDAALAANAVLGVVYPHMCGIGGDAFWLVYDPAALRVSHLNAGGRAVADATPDSCSARGLDSIPQRGILPATLTVPGCVAGWCEASAAHGRLPLARVLEPAIGYAREGFAVTARLAGWIEREAELLLRDRHATKAFFPGGRAPVEGQRLAFGDLARTLEAIGDGGHEAFYAGEIARSIRDWAAAEGGFADAEAWAAQGADWGESISTTYRGVTIHETPPPTQGITVIEALNLLEGFDVGSLDYLGPDHVHLLAESIKLAFADRDRLIADPLHADVPTETVASKPYASERRAALDPQRASQPDPTPHAAPLVGDTVYVCAIDARGNAASLIQSLYMGFGSGVVAGDSGVLLQNRSHYFTLEPGHPNCLAPGKQPLHTLIASLAFRDDDLWAVVGSMGADGQPQIHLQLYSAMLDHGRSIEEAIASPRWLAGRFFIGDPDDPLNVEAGFADATLAGLEHRGHRLEHFPARTEKFGHAHGIVVQPGTGTRFGAADPRSDGAACGY